MNLIIPPSITINEHESVFGPRPDLFQSLQPPRGQIGTSEETEIRPYALYPHTRVFYLRHDAGGAGDYAGPIASWFSYGHN